VHTISFTKEQAMAANPLKKLHDLGQSVWLDLIRRNMLGPGGELERLIEEEGIRGVTSNPAIFEKAINGSSDYDDALLALARVGKPAEAIYEALAIEDVGRAADLFRDVYDEDPGADGFVSIEVSPHLARDTAGTIAEARRLWAALDRPNILIKVPGTREGLPAIRALLAEGINVNITLLFAVQRYEEVLEQHLLALEERVRARRPIEHIASVASFFLSRIDTLLDPLIAKNPKAKGLEGRIAIANAKLAHEAFARVISGSRWQTLAAKGARVQRLLWASTSTKNPAYPDTMYVEPLIGPDTVNTMPTETVEAYRDHGQPAARLAEGLSDAKRDLARLRDVGIDLDAATAQLEDEGVRKFVEPFDKLLSALRKKRTALAGTGS
jgi:transaldolase